MLLYLGYAIDRHDTHLYHKRNQTKYLVERGNSSTEVGANDEALGSYGRSNTRSSVLAQEFRSQSEHVGRVFVTIECVTVSRLRHRPTRHSFIS